jgi:hypothetical protein
MRHFDIVLRCATRQAAVTIFATVEVVGRDFLLCCGAPWQPRSTYVDFVGVAPGARRKGGPDVRLRIIKTMRGEVDGISLAQFRVGQAYDVGTAVGSYLLALRAAVPVIEEPPAGDVGFNLPKRTDGGPRPKQPRKGR